MLERKQMLTYERANELFMYEPETGMLLYIGGSRRRSQGGGTKVRIP